MIAGERDRDTSILASHDRSKYWCSCRFGLFEQNAGDCNCHCCI